MSDRSVYDQMAAREQEVWGNMLPKLERSQARAEDFAAAVALKVTRYQSSLTGLARKKGLRFKRGLTLGCGAGRLERTLLKDGICQNFHGIDISENAIADAREFARQNGLAATYEVADLNFIKLPEKQYDLVAAQTSLHHILFLENVAEQIWKTLQSDGWLWVHDFIGETQGQYEEKRLAIINAILAALPEKFRTDRVTGWVTKPLMRPEPGKLLSPFEKIRSEEIVTVLERWFTTEWKMEFHSLLDVIGIPGTRVAFNENDDTRALYEVLIRLDQVLIEQKILKPAGGQYLMRPRPKPL